MLFSRLLSFQFMLCFCLCSMLYCAHVHCWRSTVVLSLLLPLLLLLLLLHLHHNKWTSLRFTWKLIVVSNSNVCALSDLEFWFWFSHSYHNLFRCSEFFIRCVVCIYYAIVFRPPIIPLANLLQCSPNLSLSSSHSLAWLKCWSDRMTRLCLLHSKSISLVIVCVCVLQPAIVRISD